MMVSNYIRAPSLNEKNFPTPMKQYFSNLQLMLCCHVLIHSTININ